MAARGSIAKEKVTNIIAKAFGKDFVGEFDKKIYVWAEENGERVQIALTMTCPKVPVGDIDYKAEPTSTLNFEDMSAAPVSTVKAQTEITEEEQRYIADLLDKLGL